jgi:hypothetical protein
MECVGAAAFEGVVLQVVEGKPEDGGDGRGDHRDGTDGLEVFHREVGAEDVLVAGGAAGAQGECLGESGEDAAEQDEDDAYFIAVAIAAAGSRGKNAM